MKVSYTYTAVWWQNLFFLTSSFLVWSQIYTILYFCRILLWRIVPSASFNLVLNYRDPGLKLLHIFFVFSLMSGELCQFTPMRICNTRTMNKNRKQMWQKKNLVANIISEHTLRVHRQSDIYDTARVCLGARKPLFTLKTIVQKYSFLWKQVRS